MANPYDIKQILDTKLRPELLGSDFQEINNNAIKLFQKIFVENLHFNLVKGQFGEVGEKISTDEWNKAAEVENAYIIADKDNFRIIYILIKKLTRYRERFAISSLRRERWTNKGEFICIFFAIESLVWDMVCPHFSEGRMILRRYVLGEGENHRTVSENLILMDASKSTLLYESIQDAFKLQVVTEEFYKKYKENFNDIKVNLLKQSIDIASAKKFAHLLLNRLMFIYFIQKKGWINNDKNFLSNYLSKYKKSKEKNIFYSKWLTNLFFEAMSTPITEKNIIEFDDEINNILNNIPFLNGGLFERCDIDNLKFSLPDELLFNITENFLDEYNFTITEESPYDLDIAIDPAMLGKIYESLIAEEERGKSGIFYTPRIEVDLMCRLGIYEYLLQDKHNLLPKNKKNIKKILLDFIFIPLEDWDMNNCSKFEFLRKALLNVKIVDPACGSGAFLVGMLQIFIELLRKLGMNSDYSIKESIIYNSIYGVDIKDWAIRMAEFRLWLSLIENEDFIPNKQPILPNFSFQLRCGDSIVQKIGDYHINFKIIRENLSKNIKEKIEHIKLLKRDFFEGKKLSIEVIQKAQIEILIEILNEKINFLKNLKKEKTQKTLDNEITEDSQKIIKKANRNLEKLEKIKDTIKKIQDVNLIFIWDICFLEVMTNGGFDIVIANPPYVSKNEIINPSLDPEIINNYKSDKKSKLRRLYKDDLNNFINTNFKYSISNSCDLYVYFFFKGLELLNKFGTMIYISSSSWLNVGFGGDLQGGILKFGHLKYIISNLVQRSFSEAEVNTIISIIRKNKKKNILNDFSKFLAFKKKFENIDYLFFNDILINDDRDLEFTFLNEKISIFNNEIVKKIKIPNVLLGKFGGEIEKSRNLQAENISLLKSYSFSKWSVFLLADEIFFKIISQNSKICRLEKYCDIFLGMTSGYNPFFYLNKEDIKKFNIENEFLVPLIKSPKDLKSPYIRTEYLRKKIFFVQKDKRELEGTNALVYIEYGENPPNQIHERPFFKKKFENRNIDEWYKLSPKSGKILLPNLIDKVHKISFNENSYLADKKLICCNPNQEKFEKAIFLILYSTFIVLAKEIVGSTSLGGGALDVSTTDYKNLYFIDLEKLDEEIINKINNLFDNFEYYDFSLTLDELGSNDIESFDLERVLKQRREIDKIIFEDIFGLNIEEQIKLYKNVINLINNRILRSKSV